MKGKVNMNTKIFAECSLLHTIKKICINIQQSLLKNYGKLIGWKTMFLLNHVIKKLMAWEKCSHIISHEKGYKMF